MMSKFVFDFALAVVAAIFLADAATTMSRDPLNNEGMFEGDMSLPVRPRFRVRDNSPRLWKHGTVYYSISAPLENKRNVIREAMDIIEENTCVRFIEITPGCGNVSYIDFIKGPGCWATLGCQNKGRQELSIGDGCTTVSVVSHELMHALGFGHMHSNQDRDKYLKIHWDNILESTKHNFELLDAYSFMPSVFDFTSIMLYESYAFSKDGVSLTMTTHDGFVLRNHPNKTLSNNDFFYINHIYRCPQNRLLWPTETTLQWKKAELNQG